MPAVEATKDIFQYEGPAGETRYGDPVAIYRKLSALLKGRIDEILENSTSADPALSLHANELLGKAVCVAFDLGDPFDERLGSGITEKVWDAALTRFLDFLDTEKKNSETPPTSPAPSPDTCNSSTPTASMPEPSLASG